MLLLALSAAVAAPNNAFFAGVNIPWHNFGYDIGSSFSKEWFDSAFANVSARGANSVRFWLHADGRASPTFAADGSVTGPGGASFASDLPSPRPSQMRPRESREWAWLQNLLKISPKRIKVVILFKPGPFLHNYPCDDAARDL